MAAGRGHATPYGPGGPRGRGYGYLRACDADRERTADALKAAYVEGRLTKDELDARLDQAYAARTYDDLGRITADLPSWSRPGLAPRPGPAAYPGPRPPSRSVSRAADEGTNGLAVGSLVCALLQLPTVGLTAIPAIVLGHTARGQIRRTGQRGDGMAVAGLVLGWLGLAFFVLFVVAIAAVAVTTGGPHTVIAHPAGS